MLGELSSSFCLERDFSLLILPSMENEMRVMKMIGDPRKSNLPTPNLGSQSISSSPLQETQGDRKYQLEVKKKRTEGKHGEWRGWGSKWNQRRLSWRH